MLKSGAVATIQPLRRERKRSGPALRARSVEISHKDRIDQNAKNTGCREQLFNACALCGGESGRMCAGIA
jgi:hypothetical protein